MSSFLSLFTSFTGRINRARWWLGMAAVGTASIGGTIVLDPSILDPSIEFAAVPVWRDTAWQLALQVPATAVAVKRFNDRDRPYWFGFLMGALAAGILLAQQFGLLTPGHPLSILEIAAITILLPVFLLAFIDNGLLRGTSGPNRYGPDPLGPDPLKPETRP